MIAIIFSSFFVLLWYKYRRKNGSCAGSWLLLWYAISSILTVCEFYTIRINSTYLDTTATTYYGISQIVALSPFLILGKYDCRHFNYNHQLFKYLAYLLIIFGFYKLIDSCGILVNNISIIFGNIAQIRYAYYDRIADITTTTPIEKLSIIINNLQFFSPFLAFYFMIKGKRNLSVCLFLASLSNPINEMTIGEREGSLKYLVNMYFCYLFFKPILHNDTIKKIKKVGIIALFPFLLFIVAMTLGRFKSNMSSKGLLESIFLYGGDQPFMFTSIFTDQNILDQLQGGKICFQYLFPLNERVQGQLNEVIESDIYLNQFAGLPGSFFLDFGYNSIIIIGIFAILYYMLIKKSKRINGKYPLHVFFLLCFSFQVLFMNVFYFDFQSLFRILFVVAFYIVCVFYPNSTDTLECIYKT